MKIFYKKKEIIEAKSKDSVLRLLYAYKKYEDPDGKKGALSFKKKKEFNNSDTDIEKAIKTIKNNADYEYMKGIVEFLHKHDYIAKVGENDNVKYFMLTKSGVRFYVNNGFEKQLKDERSLSSENFYKLLTLIIAVFAVTTPILYDYFRNERINDNLEKIDNIEKKLDNMVIENQIEKVDSLMIKN